MQHGDDDTLPFEAELAPSRPPSPVDRIRTLNDTLRRTGAGGRVILTPSVATLDPLMVQRIIEAVRDFETFDHRNDPHGEHDCAIVDIDDSSILFKIDYYDLDMQCHSADPADREVTRRVLTIMMADDY